MNKQHRFVALTTVRLAISEAQAVATITFIDNRMRPQKVMVRNGFQPIDCEWWHFSLKNEPCPRHLFCLPGIIGLFEKIGASF